MPFLIKRSLRVISKFKAVLKSFARARRAEAAAEQILLNQGKILTGMFAHKDAARLCEYEWKVFSQWGEDGIIQFLISEIEIEHHTFIEFGVEAFFESNCRYLLQGCDWQGFVIDGSQKNIARLRQSDLYWRHDLQSVAAFVDKDNINSLLTGSGFDRDLGVLSIDLDGNDYHILEAINCFEPRIIICEFNPYFGRERAVSVPYDPKFYRTEKHYSNLYFGASLKAFIHLLEGRGYRLIGTGAMGGNAYFVRKDLVNAKLEKLSQNPIHFNGNCRESVDQNGNLTFLRGEERLKAIRGMPVVNVITGKSEAL
ncbi:hypothetical protein [Thalassospira povalilytica]|uniref:Methyltransferase FkbM domain-containing protein n=1 Tax=Thalassospira povalilytica TaxID=732237 RepID=A0ABX4R4L3_9PROT|nr:hypothetical protein [Thalassospira povalilytica]PKR47895.1 hypothetical protein CU041_17675 [Thalassospira povalilytica]